MAWTPSEHFLATNATDTDSISAGINTYYDKRFLERMTASLKVAPFAQKRPIPEGNGKTVEFFRWLELAVDPDTDVLAEGSHNSAIQIDGQKLSVSLIEYGKFAQLSSLIKQAHIDVNLEGAVDIFAEHAARTVDYLAQRELVANGAIPIACDASAENNTTNTFYGALTSVTSTTIVNDTAIASNTGYGNENYDLNQSVLVFTSGPNKGIGANVANFTTAGGIITLAKAMPNTPTDGDTYIVTSPDSLTATGAAGTGDYLDFYHIKKGRALLKKFSARPIMNGYFVGIIDSESASMLMDDPRWQDVQKYESNTHGIMDGEIGKFGGVRFIEHTHPFYMPIITRGTAGTAGGPGLNGVNQVYASGALVVVANFILGADAFGVSTFAKKSGQATKPHIIVKNPGSGDTSNPLNRYSTVGWQLELAHKSLNALHAVQLWSNANY